MKNKIILIMLIFITSMYSYKVNALEEVKLVNCSSISNIWVESSEGIKRIHLIGIEIPNGELDQEINEYICSTLKNAKVLEIEYEGTKTDKYNRDLVNLYVDKKLFQEELISKGYAYVDNITSYFGNTSHLCEVEKGAIINNLGIWNYPNIKEPYCKNNITIKETNESTLTKEENKKNYNIQYMILINCGILLLLVLMKREFYGKR